MANNFEVTAGTGTTIAAEEVSSAKHQTVKSLVATDKMIGSGELLTPLFAAIAASGSGNNTIVAAVTSKKIRVLALSMMASAAVNGKFQSGAGGTDISGLYYMAANGGIILPFNPAGWFETASGVLLNLNLSSANAVGGSLTYITVS